LTEEEKTTEEETRGSEVQIKAPKSMHIYEVEITGDLCIIRATQTLFNKFREATFVYKRVR